MVSIEFANPHNVSIIEKAKRSFNNWELLRLQ